MNSAMKSNRQNTCINSNKHKESRICVEIRSVKEDVDLQSIASRCELYTGAELAALCREAGLNALRQDMEVIDICGMRLEDADALLSH